MSNRFYVVLSANDFDRDPRFITNELGIKPTRIALKGQSSPPSRRNRWLISSDDLTTSRFLNDHWDSIMSRITDCKRFTSYMKDYYIDIEIVIFGSYDGDLNIPKSMIHLSSELRSEIKIVQYND